MTVGQFLAAGAGAVAIVIGIWLLRNTGTIGDKQAEAKTPLFSISGSPGLLLTLAGLFLIVFPFTPWWPSSSIVQSDSDVGPDGAASLEFLRLEAESGAVVRPMHVERDDSASAGRYIATSAENEGSVTITFQAAGGTYHVWGRVAAPTGRSNTNSVFVSLDGQGPDVWDFFEQRTATEDLPSDWQWERLSLRCDGSFDTHYCDPWKPRLAEGNHTLVIRGREADSRVDVLIVTNDPEYSPQQG